MRKNKNYTKLRKRRRRSRRKKQRSRKGGVSDLKYPGPSIREKDIHINPPVISLGGEWIQGDPFAHVTNSNTEGGVNLDAAFAHAEKADDAADRKDYATAQRLYTAAVAAFDKMLRWRTLGGTPPGLIRAKIVEFKRLAELMARRDALYGSTGSTTPQARAQAQAQLAQARQAQGLPPRRRSSSSHPRPSHGSPPQNENETKKGGKYSRRRRSRRKKQRNRRKKRRSRRKKRRSRRRRTKRR